MFDNLIDGICRKVASVANDFGVLKRLVIRKLRYVVILINLVFQIE
jgi:hypothetical protein